MVAQQTLSPEQALADLKRRIKVQWTWAFGGTAITGLLVHLYRMVNFLQVDDTPYYVYSAQDSTFLGRWLLQWAGAISSYMELPALNALLAIGYLGLFAVVLVELLQIETPFLCGLIGGCLAVLPAFSTTLLFAYAADPYMLALLLAGAAVLAARRWESWRGIAAGAVMLCLSMAIYQAYLDVAVLLCLLVCFKAVLQDGPRKMLPVAGRMAGMGVIGVAGYMLSAKLALALQGIEASDYGGFASMGSLDPVGSLQVVKEIYLGSRHIFLDKLFYATNLFWQLLGWAILGLMGLMAVALLAAGIREQGMRAAERKAVPYWLLGGVILLLLPAGATTLAIPQPNTFPYNSLNGFANGLFVIIPLVFADWLRSSLRAWVQGGRWATLAAVLLMSWQFVLVANQAARLLEVIEQRDLANTNRILSRLEMQEGYSINSTVFFAGKSVPVASESPLMQYGDRLRLNIRGLHTDSLLYGDFAYRVFMNDNFGTNFSAASTDTQNSILASAEYAAMKPWPDESCIRWIGDVLAVRLAE